MFSRLEKKIKDLQIAERNAIYETHSTQHLQSQFNQLQAGSKKLAEKNRDSEKEIGQLKALLDAQKQQKEMTLVLPELHDQNEAQMCAN